MFAIYERLVHAIAQRPRAFSIFFLVLSVAVFFGASHVRLDGDLARLLPESSSAVQGLRELEKVYGDEIGRVTIVLSGPDLEVNRLAADAIAKDLEGIPGIDRIEEKDPRTDIRALRLLYIDTADLETLDARLSKRIRWEKQRANPLFVDLGGKARPEVDITDIEEKYKGKTGDRVYYEGPEGQVLVFVHPSFPASRLTESRELVEAVQKRVDATLTRFPGIKAELTGRYVKRIEQQDILTQDIARATPIALLLLSLFLVLYFRSFISAVFVVVPLAVGTAAGMTFAISIFGDLNILTGFLGAILMGLGVDYGIHLISRYLEVRRTEPDPAKAWVKGFQTAGRASIYAGLTTMVALGSLAVSTFRAFLEFGVIAMGGIFLILVAYATILPTLLFLRSGPPLKPSLAGVISDLLVARLNGFSLRERLVHLNALIGASAAVLVVAGAIGIYGIPNVSFDRTFSSLTMAEGNAWALDQMVNEILGESQTPAVVMVANEAHRQAVVEALRARQAGPDGHAIASILSLDDLIPSDQAKKLDILAEIKRRIEDIPPSARSQELVDFFEEIDRVIAHGEITAANLPRNLYVPFSRKDSKDAGIVLIMPGVDLNQADGSHVFTRAIRGLPAADGKGTIDAVADSILLVDIMDYVERDTEWMVGLTLVGLLIISFMAFGASLDVLKLFGFLCFSIVAGVGAVAASGHDFNFVNVLVMPIWLGLGVDASFHLLIHLRAHPDDFGELISTTISVGGAFLTSVIGFATLTISHHKGLYSLGWVAACGLTVILICSVAIAVIMGARVQLKLLK